MIALNNNKFHKFYYDCPLHNLFYFPLEYLQKPSSLLASFCISWDFLFNALTFGYNLKFLFFSASFESLRNSAWIFLLILMPSAIESFTSWISLLMMANWVHCVFCFRDDSFSLKNILKSHWFQHTWWLQMTVARLWLFIDNDWFSGSNLYFVHVNIKYFVVHTKSSFHCCFTMT